MAACWISQEPILNDSNASDIPFEGTFASGDNPQEVATISKGAGMAYEIGADGRSESFYFMEVSPEWFVFQFSDPVKEEKEIRYGSEEGQKGKRKPTGISGYQFIRWRDGRIETIEPVCTKEVAAVEGVKGDEKVCSFETFEQLKGSAKIFAAAVDAGEIQAKVDKVLVSVAN
ncbi:hypothetical protein EH32_04530 [Erythrobacter litoralis]|uniref:Uncharacterized protein n=1 Tax=Erythrobacter litoralis TaxID=39960 RepID=A0A074N4K0_9SPHN|nr:hypothetical protein EH32_04530 [Erythrobacter litoralis]